MWKCINDLDSKHAHIGHINSNCDIDSLPQKIIKWYNNASSFFDDDECINCEQLPNCIILLVILVGLIVE
ncbi:MAG: hypothetical protein ABF289_18925 [Clostridiales bacterium]